MVPTHIPAHTKCFLQVHLLLCFNSPFHFTSFCIDFILVKLYEIETGNNKHLLYMHCIQWPHVRLLWVFSRVNPLLHGFINFSVVFIAVYYSWDNQYQYSNLRLVYTKKSIRYKVIVQCLVYFNVNVYQSKLQTPFLHI